MFEELFLKRKINTCKAVKYGFKVSEKEYRFEKDILNGSFTLTVVLDLCGFRDTFLTDKYSEEEYVLYKTNAEGAFLGKVRAAVSEVLSDISEKCFDSSVYSQEQTLKLVSYIGERYGHVLDFPFSDDNQSGILRNPGNKKWYGIIMRIPKSKLGFEDKRHVEVVNLHGRADEVSELVSRPHFYPGWHMNKKYWYTVILDGSVDDNELFELVDKSFILTERKK